MKTITRLYNYLPKKTHYVYWQITLIPTISLFRNLDKKSGYFVINIEWLFWSINMTIYATNKRKKTKGIR